LASPEQTGGVGRGEKRLILQSNRQTGRIVEKDLHSRPGVIDGITNQLERYMDLLSARQKLVVSNIANIDTPGYKTKDIDFQFEFQNAAASAQGPDVLEAPGLVTKSDGNNVSLDREARLLAENALRFSVAASLMKSQLKAVESAIKEGQG
jgi:flagellar basal-body rod protein FlgB